MARTGRPGLSDTYKRELWRDWRAGQTLSEIGLALGKRAGSIGGVVAANGNIRPKIHYDASGRDRGARPRVTCDDHCLTQDLDVLTATPGLVLAAEQAKWHQVGPAFEHDRVVGGDAATPGRTQSHTKAGGSVARRLSDCTFLSSVNKYIC